MDIQETYCEHCGDPVCYDADNQCEPSHCAECRRHELLWQAQRERNTYLFEIYCESLTEE